MADFAWDGVPLGQDDIALVVLTSDRSPSSSSTTVVLAAASTGIERRVLRPDEIGPFLLAHRDRRLICDDCVFFHRTIEDHLESAHNSGVVETLWGFSREGRLHDVRLLGQLVEIAHGVSDPPPRRLSDLAVLLGVEPPAEDGEQPRRAAEDMPWASVSEQLGPWAVRIADAILAIHRRLRDAAKRVMSGLAIKPEVAEPFGPLGLGIEVRGAIALARATRNGLRLRADIRAELEGHCSAVYREASAQLGEDPGARRCFHWDGPSVRLKKGRFPDVIVDNLEGWLERTAGTIPGLHAIPLEPPRSGSGRVAGDHDRWGIEARCHPLLAAWSRLMAAASLKSALERLEMGGDRRLRPGYEVVPAIRSSNPNLSAARRLFPAPIFEAAAGRSLLVVALRDLELRCVGEVTQRRGGQSQLAGWFRAGLDPVAYAAVRLHAAGALRWEEFLALEINQPDEYRGWRLEAQTFLSAVVRGLTDAQARELLRQDHGIEIDAATARRYYELLADEVGLERPYWRAEDTFEAVRFRLGCTVEELAPLMMPGEIEEAEAALRNLIAGRRKARDAFARLHAICRDQALQERLAGGEGSAELYEAFFARDVVTPSGRARVRMFFTQARAAEFLDLADAVRKSALYAVVAADYQLGGFADDQFVIEVPEGAAGSEAGREIRDAVDKAASILLGNIARLCDVRRVEAW